MNRPTTRTEQILASASKGVSSRLILAEAAGFVETGEIFVSGLIQRLLRKAGEPQNVRKRSLQNDDFICVRLSSSLRLARSLSNPRATQDSPDNAACERLVGDAEVTAMSNFMGYFPIDGDRTTECHFSEPRTHNARMSSEG